MLRGPSRGSLAQPFLSCERVCSDRCHPSKALTLRPVPDLPTGAWRREPGPTFSGGWEMEAFAG